MSDTPANDPNDLMTQQAIQNDSRSLTVEEAKAAAGVDPVPPADPENRNLAMQLALQKNGASADMNTLKASAEEFYSYLTQHE